jgi:hypothetical protein
MGRTGNRHLVFDAQVEATGNSVIFSLDLFTGDAAQLGVAEQGLGYPTFAGDEAAVVYAQRDFRAASTGFSLVHQRLTPDRLGVQGDPTLWTYDARLAVLYRRGTFTGSNALPSSAITAPTAGAILTVGTPASISVQASDTDGTIAKVEFFDGDDRLGEVTSAPFRLAWTPSSAGPHRLIARATDNFGGAGDSIAVLVSVISSTPTTPARLAASLLPDRRLRLSIRGQPGSYILARSTDLRAWTDLRTVTVDASGEAVTDETPSVASGAVFYQVRRP